MQVGDVLTGIKDKITPGTILALAMRCPELTMRTDHLVVSICAGVTLATLEGKLNAGAKVHHAPHSLCNFRNCDLCHAAPRSSA